MSVSYCGNCGSSNDVNSQFCGDCGNKLEVIDSKQMDKPDSSGSDQNITADTTSQSFSRPETGLPQQQPNQYQQQPGQYQSTIAGGAFQSKVFKQTYQISYIIIALNILGIILSFVLFGIFDFITGILVVLLFWLTNKFKKVETNGRSWLMYLMILFAVLYLINTLNSLAIGAIIGLVLSARQVYVLWKNDEIKAIFGQVSYSSPPIGYN